MSNLSFAGGSLDVYKRIPEHVLGRIAVAVSFHDILKIIRLCFLITECEIIWIGSRVFWIKCAVFQCVTVNVCLAFTVSQWDLFVCQTQTKSEGKTHVVNEIKREPQVWIFPISFFLVKWRMKSVLFSLFLPSLPFCLPFYSQWN